MAFDDGEVAALLVGVLRRNLVGAAEQTVGLLRFGRANGVAEGEREQCDEEARKQSHGMSPFVGTSSSSICRSVEGELPSTWICSLRSSVLPSGRRRL